MKRPLYHSSHTLGCHLISFEPCASEARVLVLHKAWYRAQHHILGKPNKRHTPRGSEHTSQTNVSVPPVVSVPISTRLSKTSSGRLGKPVPTITLVVLPQASSSRCLVYHGDIACAGKNRRNTMVSQFRHAHTNHTQALRTSTSRMQEALDSRDLRPRRQAPQHGVPGRYAGHAAGFDGLVYGASGYTARKRPPV